MDHQILLKYFPNFSEHQIEQFSQLQSLYTHWNAQINVVSRKDIEELYVRHVLHSLAIQRLFTFKPGTRILDLGTGGGFPGIPLAIANPECDFLLVDSIGKKIKVVNEVAKGLGLSNVRGVHQRVEDVDGKFDFVVSRAVARTVKLIQWSKKSIHVNHAHDFKNGFILLKGGDLSDELKEINRVAKEYIISDLFEEQFFDTKKVIYIPIKR